MNIKPTLLLLMLAFLSCASARAAKIEYPLLDNLRLEEGTIELWLTPMVDMDPPIDKQKYIGILKLFQLGIPNEFHISCVWALRPHDKAKDGRLVGLGASCSSTKMKKAMLPLPLGVGSSVWKQGQQHHLAFTWQSKQMRLYADGKPAGHRIQTVAMHGRRAKHVFVIGNDWSRPEPFILHAVRISSIARDPATLGDSKPVADISTLLLDLFDSPTSHEKPPVVSSNLVDAESRKIIAPVHWVDLPHPGLALYPPADADID